MKKQVEKTVMHHLSAFQEADIDALMNDYTENSKLITPDVVLVGKNEIMQFLSELSLHFPVGKSEINLEKFITDDDLAYIVWNAKTPTLKISLASDTFVIKEGKILKQTFVGNIEQLS